MSEAQTLPGFGTGSSHTSLSRQFVVHGGNKDLVSNLREIAIPRDSNGQKMAQWLARVPNATVGDKIELEPRLAAVSAERIKITMLRLLKQPDHWKGQVHIYLVSPNKWQGATEIRPVAFRDGWRYAVIVPEEIEWQRFVRTIAAVILMETVNRADPQRWSEPPLWLTEGIAELLLISPGRGLVLESDRTYTSIARRADLSAEARKLLAGQGVLDWTEISNASVADFKDEESYNHFRGSALLLTDFLLVRPEGSENLGRFVDGLGSVLNWQTAFLRAYHNDFRSMLDVEKWWAVSDAADAINGSTGMWPKDTVIAHLGDVFVESVTPEDVAIAGRDRRSMPLSELIVTWDFKRQREVLDRKLTQLRMLLAHADRTLSPLVEEAYRTLDKYSEDRSTAGRDPESRSQLEARAQIIARAASRKIAVLEHRVNEMRIRR
ncbi:MAG TPA: hypothetical protein VMF06_09995 [Candidatus Limnocylindria bacterium]|nr:hypothetical protein [Candidatus Limnocylindria bacterium]